jgi:hypothetical protein
MLPDLITSLFRTRQSRVVRDEMAALLPRRLGCSQQFKQLVRELQKPEALLLVGN